jgi:hypothetical protein
VAVATPALFVVAVTGLTEPQAAAPFVKNITRSLALAGPVIVAVSVDVVLPSAGTLVGLGTIDAPFPGAPGDFWVTVAEPEPLVAVSVALTAQNPICDDEVYVTVTVPPATVVADVLSNGPQVLPAPTALAVKFTTSPAATGPEIGLAMVTVNGAWLVPLAVITAEVGEKVTVFVSAVWVMVIDPLLAWSASVAVIVQLPTVLDAV